MTRTPMNMTYEIALANFRNAVNSKLANNPATPHQTRRGINQVRGSFRGRGGRSGRGARGYGGRSPGGRSGRGRGNNHSGITRKCDDSTLITLTDGTIIEYHPSFKFADDVFYKFKPEDK